MCHLICLCKLCGREFEEQLLGVDRKEDPIELLAEFNRMIVHKCGNGEYGIGEVIGLVMPHA